MMWIFYDTTKKYGAAPSVENTLLHKEMTLYPAFDKSVNGFMTIKEMLTSGFITFFY